LKALQSEAQEKERLLTDEVQRYRLAVSAQQDEIDRERNRTQNVFNVAQGREAELLGILEQTGLIQRQLDEEIQRTRGEKEEVKGVAQALYNRLQETGRQLVDTNIAWNDRFERVSWESEELKRHLGTLKNDLDRANQHLVYTNTVWANSNEGLADQIQHLQAQQDIDNGNWQLRLEHILEKKQTKARNGVELAREVLGDNILKATLLFEHIQGDVPGYVEERWATASLLIEKFDDQLNRGNFDENLFKKAFAAVKSFSSATTQHLVALDRWRQGKGPNPLTGEGPGSTQFSDVVHV